MARNNPVHNLLYSEWDDGELDYGFDHGDSDVRLFLLARKGKTFTDHKRDEDGPRMDLEEYRYQFYHPDELAVDEYQRMKNDGWEFVDVSYADFVDMVHFSDFGRGVYNDE